MPPTIARRWQTVHLGPGVRVRQDQDGNNLCRVNRCKEPPLTLGKRHRGFCSEHYRTVADGRPLCCKCRRNYAIEPYADEFCEHCSPLEQETTPFESHVLHELRNGGSLSQAVARTMPEGSHPLAVASAARRLTKRAGSLARIRVAMEKAGVNPRMAAEKLKQNINAKKAIFNKEGEMIAEVDDVRGSNQALDLYFKVSGAYVKKVRGGGSQNTQVNVAVLPAEEPRRADAQIYTLPTVERSSDESE